MSHLGILFEGSLASQILVLKSRFSSTTQLTTHINIDKPEIRTPSPKVQSPKSPKDKSELG